MEQEIIDIYSKSDDKTASLLSNFSHFPFTLDGIRCEGMEGFLQSLKFFRKSTQRKVCALWGKPAKEAGTEQKIWKRLRLVHWNGKLYRRSGKAFSLLIGRAYHQMYLDNPEFRRALESSRGKRLAHSMGGHSKAETILTEEEFVGHLNRLRDGKP
ncbi:MAG: hypothetical protein IKB34_08340 [Clostridia bacterium]|nr:hypothetical protein [Clostridia bacterium]